MNESIAGLHIWKRAGLPVAPDGTRYLRTNRAGSSLPFIIAANVLNHPARYSRISMHHFVYFPDHSIGCQKIHP